MHPAASGNDDTVVFRPVLVSVSILSKRRPHCLARFSRKRLAIDGFGAGWGQKQCWTHRTEVFKDLPTSFRLLLDLPVDVPQLKPQSSLLLLESPSPVPVFLGQRNLKPHGVPTGEKKRGGCRALVVCTKVKYTTSHPCIKLCFGSSQSPDAKACRVPGWVPPWDAYRVLYCTVLDFPCLSRNPPTYIGRNISYGELSELLLLCYRYHDIIMV